MFFTTKISKDSSSEAHLGWPWQGSKDALAGWEAGKAAQHWELCKRLSDFLWKAKGCSSNPVSNTCKALCKQHSKGSYVHSRGLARRQGKDKLAWSQPPPRAVNPGDSTPSWHRQMPRKPAPRHAPAGLLEKQRNHCPWQCCENLEMCTLGTQSWQQRKPSCHP